MREPQSMNPVVDFTNLTMPTAGLLATSQLGIFFQHNRLGSCISRHPWQIWRPDGEEQHLSPWEKLVKEPSKPCKKASQIGQMLQDVTGHFTTKIPSSRPKTT